MGYRVKEVPVTWGHDERSRMSYLKDGLTMLEELAGALEFSDRQVRTCRPSQPPTQPRREIAITAADRTLRAGASI